jgi:hypothetical protein
MFILVPLLASLVTALAAPRRRFLVGVSILPVVCIGLFALAFAWDSIALPLTYDEGIAGALLHLRGLFPGWAGACIVGAALGWAVKLRRVTPPNTSFERTREG